MRARSKATLPVLVTRRANAGRKNKIMKKTETNGQATENETASMPLRDRALERIRESAGAADRIAHDNTYKLLAAGTIFGFVIGFLVSRGCRWHSGG
jgi:ElaB/YqjD/DUF883 family membrane-anchored ribosome-binding protein